MVSTGNQLHCLKAPNGHLLLWVSNSDPQGELLLIKGYSI